MGDARKTKRPKDLSWVVRVVYSGFCMCGHSVDDHHCQLVQDPRIAEILGTDRGPDMCEFYGANEDAGVDATGNLHCLQYVDRDEPDPKRRAMWADKLEASRAREEEDRRIAAGDPAAIKRRDEEYARAKRALLRRMQTRRRRHAREVDQGGMVHASEPRLQAYSDLHLEFYPRKDMVQDALERSIRPVEGATACVLAGDIAVPTGSHRRWLDIAFQFFSERYEQVFYVPGNHEFYGAPAATALEKVRTVARKYPRVTMLEPGVVGTWSGHRVIGATLWFRRGRYNARHASLLADFSEIRDFVPWVYEQNHAHIAWLNETVGEGDIVVTHHLPSRRSVAARFSRAATNVFFVCDVEKLIEERRPALWVHGHTHDSFHYQIGSTTVLCNPLGYWGEESPSFGSGVWVAPRSERR